MLYEVITAFYRVIGSTLRTNYYQTGEGGEPKDYVSFKLDSQSVPDLPLPRPFREIWVYSPRFEGIHLRAGRIARGGLRWSDRREDFRTEVLGLMKAQNVKNTIIVPVGAKGGFVITSYSIHYTKLYESYLTTSAGGSRLSESRLSVMSSKPLMKRL